MEPKPTSSAMLSTGRPRCCGSARRRLASGQARSVDVGVEVAMPEVLVDDAAQAVLRRQPLGEASEAQAFFERSRAGCP